MTEKSSVVNIRLSMFGPERYHCPASVALKAHGMWPLRRGPRKWESLEPFANGPFMAALDRTEFPPGGPQPDRPGGNRPPLPVHDGVRRWTEHALRMYAEAFEDGPAMHPVPCWTYKYRQGTGEFRINAWGRAYASADGLRRELRLPVNRLRERSEVERAIAAWVTAEGDEDGRVEHVRVVQFSLSDGRPGVLFDGTRAEAVALYREHGAPAVRALLADHAYRPGRACAECAVSSVCPAVPRAPGLLGIADRTRPRRSWSPSTTGRGQRACAARAYLRGLRLPVDDSVERNAAAERGRAVHAVLATRHSGSGAVPCSPEVPEDWVPEGYRLPPEEQALGARLLRHHAEVCPLLTAEPGSVPDAEPMLVIDDTGADLLVMTEPDLLYREDGAWVWRETKTSGSRLIPRRPLSAYPQLALAVRIVAQGLLKADRVELELLRPGGADLRALAPRDPATVAEAEAVLSGRIVGWHGDRLFEPTPGPECADCEVARWCSARQAPESDREAP